MASRYRSLTSRPWAAELVWVCATVVFTLIVTSWVYHLWDADWRYPWLSGSGDGLVGISVVKGMIEHGWYWTNSSLGAPDGQQQFDYVVKGGDALQLAALRVITLFTSNPAAAVNVYFVLGFVLVACSAYLICRMLGLSRPTATVCGVLFAFLPYHLVRGQGHLFLAAYFAIPFGAWLFVRTLRGQPLLQPGASSGPIRRWLTAPAVLTVIAIVVCGMSTLYYAVFTILLVGFAALIRALATVSWRSALPGLAVSALVCAALFVAISPGVVYQADHGTNETVAERHAFESELYSLTFTQLIVPITRHRIEKLARAGMRLVNHTSVPGEGGMQLGFVLALSFVALLLLLASYPLRAGPRGETAPLAVAAAIGAAVAFLIATFGGVSSVVAYYVSPQIRGWDRMVPFIAFFAAIGLGIGLDLARARLARRRHGALLGGALVAGVLLFGVWDQTAPSYPAYAADQARWRADGRFVAAIERIAPDQGMVLQLPFAPYPEAGPTFDMPDYDLLRGYVHSHDLRWSYGSMKGRPDDWSDEAANQRIQWVVPAAAARGFTGIYIDRFGYPDRGRAIERQIRERLGVRGPTIVSADHRLAYYDLATMRRRVARVPAPDRSELGEMLVEPLEVRFASGFSVPGSDDTQTWRDITSRGEIELSNPDDDARRETLTGILEGWTGTVTIALPGRAPQRVAVGRGGRRISLPFAAPPGSSRITIGLRGAGGDKQPTVRLRNPRVENGLPSQLTADPES